DRGGSRGAGSPRARGARPDAGRRSLTSVGGIEELDADPRAPQRVERRLAAEGLRHLRLRVGQAAWRRGDEALADAVARLAGGVRLVVACEVDPSSLVGRPELLRRWAHVLASHQGALELPAEPPVGSI